MDYVADTDSNPFGMDPPCERSVPGYGDTGADFHVVGDSPAVHGGLEAGVPFTDRSWSGAFFDALVDAGLIERGDDGSVLELDGTYLSYLCLCDTGGDPPTDDDYRDTEAYFDAELRAITAHVLLPVGERATRHVLDTYSAHKSENLDMDALHGTEIEGSGWLVVPIKDPSTWADGDAETVVQALLDVRGRDYRRTADLGRFMPGEESYLVR